MVQYCLIKPDAVLLAFGRGMHSVRRRETKGSAPALSRAIQIALWTSSVVLAFCFGCPAQQTASDYQLEAAYIYNFAKLAEWPKQNLPDGDPFVIGVVGGDADFFEVLARAVAGKTIATHPVVARHLSPAGDFKSCQLLFFRSSERTRMQDEIAGLGQSSILLVGEDKSFLRQGGLINLVVENGTIRFQVDANALERANIHFSPQVLAQAQIEPRSIDSPATGLRKIEFKVRPDYPPLARRMNLKGIVQVQATVGRDGTVKKVTLLGGHPVLAEAALQAVMKWKYEPAPQETLEMVRVSFGEVGSN